MRHLKKVITSDPTIRQLQNNVEQITSPILDKQIIDGVLLRNVNLTALQANLVHHNLGRKAIGWIITRKRSDSRIWDIDDLNNNKGTIALTCSNDVSVDLWIF